MCRIGGWGVLTSQGTSFRIHFVCCLRGLSYPNSALDELACGKSKESTCAHKGVQ